MKKFSQNFNEAKGGIAAIMEGRFVGIKGL